MGFIQTVPDQSELLTPLLELELKSSFCCLWAVIQALWEQHLHHLYGPTCDLYLFQQLKMAKLEIRDLQAEFEVERNDLLATIRKLERDAQLMKGLLERMVPLVRRDCNYSNLDRLMKEAVWDEESATWRLPDVVVQKTELPSGGAVANRK